MLERIFRKIMDGKLFFGNYEGVFMGMLKCLRALVFNYKLILGVFT